MKKEFRVSVAKDKGRQVSMTVHECPGTLYIGSLADPSSYTFGGRGFLGAVEPSTDTEISISEDGRSAKHTFNTDTEVVQIEATKPKDVPLRNNKKTTELECGQIFANVRNRATGQQFEVAVLPERDECIGDLQYGPYVLQHTWIISRTYYNELGAKGHVLLNTSADDLCEMVRATIAAKVKKQKDEAKAGNRAILIVDTAGLSLHNHVCGKMAKRLQDVSIEPFSEVWLVATVAGKAWLIGKSANLE